MRGSHERGRKRVFLTLGEPAPVRAEQAWPVVAAEPRRPYSTPLVFAFDVEMSGRRYARHPLLQFGYALVASAPRYMVLAKGQISRLVTGPRGEVAVVSGGGDSATAVFYSLETMQPLRPQPDREKMADITRFDFLTWRDFWSNEARYPGNHAHLLRMAAETRQRDARNRETGHSAWADVADFIDAALRHATRLAQTMGVELHVATDNPSMDVTAVTYELERARPFDHPYVPLPYRPTPMNDGRYEFGVVVDVRSLLYGMAHALEYGTARAYDAARDLWVATNRPTSAHDVWSVIRRAYEGVPALDDVPHDHQAHNDAERTAKQLQIALAINVGLYRRARGVVLEQVYYARAGDADAGD